jgi:hypothetical protein
MKSVKIGTNTTAEHIYKSKHQHAQNLLNHAKAFVSELIPLETLETDIETFKQSFSGYVQTFIKNDKVLSKLSGIDHIINLAALQTLEKRYNEYKQPEQMDFDIFATTEQQVKAFEYSSKLCELLNSQEQPELIHHLRNSIIPLVDNLGDTFKPDSTAILMLK